MFFQDADLPSYVTVGRDLHNGANFRRAQIGVEGRVYRDFNYEFVFDFGSSGTERAGQIYLLRVAYTGIPFFTINAGAIQPKFTLDDSTSSAEITFLERASIVNAILDPFGGSDSRRGVELIYQRPDLFRGGDNLLISTAFTGERIAAIKTDDEGSQLTGRVAYRFHSDESSNYPDRLRCGAHPEQAERTAELQRPARDARRRTAARRLRHGRAYAGGAPRRRDGSTESKAR